MLDLLTSSGLVRQWTLVNGEARCILDAIDPGHADAPTAYGRSLAIQDLLERDSAGSEDDDVAALRRVRSGDATEEDHEILTFLEDAAPVTPSISPPMEISDRQFAQALAMRGIITMDEALSFVSVGALPAALTGFVDAIPDANQKWAVKMLLTGAKEFRRDHPLVPVLGAAFGFDAHGLDVFWAECAAL